MGLVRREIGDRLSIVWQLPVGAEAAWDHLVDLTRWPAWLGTPLGHDLRPGGRVVVDHGDGYLCTSVVTRVDVGHSLAMTWSFPDEHPTGLTITIASDGPDSSFLTLDHDDLGPLVPSYAIGWLVHLTYLEASATGADMPLSQFWALHQTLEHLGRHRTSDDAV